MAPSNHGLIEGWCFWVCISITGSNVLFKRPLTAKTRFVLCDLGLVAEMDAIDTILTKTEQASPTLGTRKGGILERFDSLSIMMQ